MLIGIKSININVQQPYPLPHKAFVLTLAVPQGVRMVWCRQSIVLTLNAQNVSIYKTGPSIYKYFAGLSDSVGDVDTHFKVRSRAYGNFGLSVSFIAKRLSSNYKTSHWGSL